MSVEDFRMKDVNELLALLDDRASTGLDLSPGDELCKEAAERIRYLSSEMANAIEVANRLQRDRIILRAALVGVVGIDGQEFLKRLKTTLEAMKTLGDSTDNIIASLAGVQALLETL